MKLLILYISAWLLLNVESTSIILDANNVAYDELSPLAEMDIISTGKTDVSPLVSMLNNARIWTDARVPYKIDFNIQEHQLVLEYLNLAIKKLNALNCAKFELANDDDADFISMQVGEFMSSHIGRQGGQQDLTIDKNVKNHGSVMHELYHALGFGHEHNRPDRNQSITVHFDNIQPDKASYYQQYRLESIFPDEVLMYDYNSLMHATSQYLPDVYIDPDKPIITRKDNGTTLGQRDEPTELDVARLKIAYSCEVCKPNGRDNTYYRYPGNCEKFYQCANHIRYAMNCPAGLHFNVKEKSCLYPNEAACEFPDDSWGPR